MTYHILIADDESDLADLISQKFRREIREGKYIFLSAKNGAEAYDIIFAHPKIDMVLTDLNMPVMDGLELLLELKNLENPPKTVVVSAHSDMENIRAAMNNGAFDFLIKPLNLQDLTLTLEKTLKAVEETNATHQRLQKAQIHVDRLSLLGHMVSGIVEEINNPVNFIYGNLEPTIDYFHSFLKLVQLYQKYYPSPAPEIEDYLKTIDLNFLKVDLSKLFDSLWMGTDRIRELVLSLNNFSKLDSKKQQKVHLHKEIETALVILNYRLKNKPERPAILVERDFRKLPEIECYPNQITQVMINIMVNAIDAMEEQNSHRTYDEIKSNPNVIKIRTDRLDNHRGAITIIDNGPGIDDDMRSKIFDPFFTTKPTGKSTGIGLSVSQYIIDIQHGGQLTCDSIPGKGTKFVIELPLSTDHTTTSDDTADKI